MADVKISALPAATTPVAGTEVLPIVQSSTTKKVAISDLTAGRTMSAAALTLTTTPLGVASGGTGLTSLAAGYIPYGNGTGAFSSSANLTFDGSRLGIGIAPDTAGLSVFTGASSDQVRIGTGGNYYKIGRNTSTGFLDFTGTQSGYAGYVWNGPSSEYMRITSGGLVGIGTSSPIGLLNVVGSSSSSVANFLSGSGALASVNIGRTAREYTIATVGSTNQFFSGTAAGDNVIAYGAGKLFIGSGHIDLPGSAAAVFDASGNLGLGVTPSAWGGGRPAIEIPGGNAFWSLSNTTNYLTQNAYFDGSVWKYKASAAASIVSQNAGAHQWYTAPSGTAGNAISFTQALTLTAAANLLLGGTSDPGGANSVYIANTASVPGTPSSGGVLYVQSGALKYKGSSGTITTLGAA